MSALLDDQDRARFTFSHPSGRCLLQVCGGNRLLNELLGRRLISCSEGFCRGVKEVGATPCTQGGRRRGIPCLRIDIIDAVDFDLPQEWATVSRLLSRASEHVVAVFFNLPDNTPPTVEREALARGVRGIFYRSDSVETFETGMAAILAGDVWFRRELLYRAAVGSLNEPARGCGDGEPAAAITARESQMLCCLAEGASNQDISDRLCVSVHTVKTHLYRIYRKLGVHSRHQAALWALETGVTARPGAPAAVRPDGAAASTR